MNRSYLNILNWVRLYLDNEEEAANLANQLHYLSCKRMKQSVGVGIVIGWVTFGILIQWLS